MSPAPVALQDAASAGAPAEEAAFSAIAAAGAKQAARRTVTATKQRIGNPINTRIML
jgi:hypothetical protein